MAKPKRKFPRNTLEDALQVPLALKDKNGGNPWATDEVAKALGIARTNNKFFYLTAASRDYGLTVGTRDAAEVTLTQLGRQAVYPASSEEERKAKLDAFLNVEPFQLVLEHYGGSKLPEKNYLANTLSTEFGIDESFHDDFISIFSDNCRYLGIGATFNVDQIPPASAGQEVSVTVATATKSSNGDSPTCFVIMPFTERHDDHPPGFFSEALLQLLTPAAAEAGFDVRTAKRQGSDVIQSTIVNDLLDADLVLADLTEHNPNVLFELGMRMAEDKPVVLVRAKGTGPIFDVDNLLRVVEYDPNLWRSTIDQDLPAIRDHIKAGWDARDDGSSYLSILRSRA